MIKILHAADLHLDAPFAGLSPDQGAARRGELRVLPTRLARLAKEHGVDLMLLAGDLFDGQRVFPETISGMTTALAATGCPVLIAPGNHDCYTDHSPYAKEKWPDNVHIFTQESPEKVTVGDITLWGGAFVAPARHSSPLAGVEAAGQPGIHIGVFHGDVGGAGDYGSLTEEEIAASGLTYLALGHIHGRSGLRRSGGTHWAYPGCTQGRGFDETGEKGCILITLHDDGRVEEEFLPLGGRTYQTLRLDVTEQGPGGALVAVLPPEGGKDIARIILTGEAAHVDVPGLLALARASYFHVTIQDETRLPTDLWARAEEETLVGHFLRTMLEKRAQAPEEEQTTIDLAVRFGLAALEQREEPMG